MTTNGNGRSKLYEYAIIWQPKERTDANGNDTTPAAKLLVEPTRILVRDDSEATIRADVEAAMCAISAFVEECGDSPMGGRSLLSREWERVGRLLQLELVESPYEPNWRDRLWVALIALLGLAVIAGVSIALLGLGGRVR